jgi:DNA-binding response OmpR family regulator
MIEEDKIQELRLAGADDFLNKPFEIEELIDRMCQLMEIESGSATPA